MEELVVAEKIGEFVLGAVINKLGEYKSKKEWSQLFVNTGEFFLKEVECGERLIEDIEYVMECLRKNTTKVYNIKAYLLVALFNAGTTMSNYYWAEVNHDMPQFAG